jgi:hypothetical protein
MYKRPVHRPVFSVDHSRLKLANPENSIVYKLIHTCPFPPYKPPPYAPIVRIEDLIFGLKRRGATDEELEALRQKNYIEPVVVVPKKTKKKKRVVQDADLDKVFSQLTKPAGKKKVLKAVVKKM